MKEALRGHSSKSEQVLRLVVIMSGRQPDQSLWREPLLRRNSMSGCGFVSTGTVG